MSVRLPLFRSTGRVVLAVGLGLAVGCARPAPPIVQTKPAEVVIDNPIAREITDFEDFPGRTDAVNAIDLRSRVTGYLDSVHFKDGSDVKQGDLLFKIDPRVYKAELERTEAALEQARARDARLKKDHERALGLKGVSAEELDRIAGDKAEAEAGVAVAIAARRLAQQNVEYTEIHAPLSGRMSRRYADPGNLIKADDTILSSVVQIDPIHVNFDIDDRTMLHARRLIQEGKMTSSRVKAMEVKVGLPDEEGFSLTGIVNFTDNKIDPGTGTLRARAVVDNKIFANNSQSGEGKSSFLLSPGLFVRVRIPIGHPHASVLVPEEAVGTDQGQKFVYILNEKDEVVYRKVRLGRTINNLRVVEPDETGKLNLSDKDRVIVSGLQRVRPGVKVTPKMAEKKTDAKAVEKTPAEKKASPGSPSGEPVSQPVVAVPQSTSATPASPPGRAAGSQ
ncbi:efflux RND transporter periplasmic adaptor subunit [Fimbriiglobus ruber]|uniref:Putative Co/Zn/Cd efflux system membrane fusion protein n=1 Tax=Fimbriiglobus ruber TaxID=1908690 RepID=A0A225EG99_9BACT|nr:efflux RND transporter periplasmic adaptor subunit [Fimbriiglobus ruber]OWK47355.1 putative Co/Zn/Cd efflux system membrane fusion protein [Fimbriiglobus ruber]